MKERRSYKTEERLFGGHPEELYRFERLAAITDTFNKQVLELYRRKRCLAGKAPFAVNNDDCLLCATGDDCRTRCLINRGKIISDTALND